MVDPDWDALIDEYGPLVGLLVLFAFMIWIRIRPAERVITESAVLFSGNDPWYHARMVQYTVRFFPSTMDFDPFSYFPYGTGRHSGFGGLFDQLIAAAALVVGMGDPSTRLIEIVTAYAPPVFGALTLLPAYILAKRLMDRWSALLTAIFLALVNGQFLTRTIVGVSDHQSAEAFFGTMALAGFIYAIEVAYVEQPTSADIRDRNWRVLRAPAMAGLLGGIGIAAYLMMWGPGVFLVFTMGAFVVVQLIREHHCGNSTEYLTFATVISFLVSALLTGMYAKSYTLSATAFSLLQPLLLTAIGFGALILWQLSDRFRGKEIDARYYPVVVATLIAGTAGIAGLIHTPIFGLIRSLVIRIYSFGLFTSPTARTVAEIAPATISDGWNAYAALFPIAVIGFVILAYRVIRRNRPTELLILFWSFTIASAYFTMIRFGYYMGVAVALLAGYAIWWVGQTANLNDIQQFDDIETYQVLVVIILVVAVVPGNVVSVNGTSQPAWETANRLGGANSAWQDELRWVRDNTPEVPLEYYDTFDRPKDGDYDYPEGTYGVMSWWDYGHWITYTGHRIPDANPFQQGPRPASAFLLAQNETHANLILEALPSMESRGEIHQMSSPELREIIESQSPQQAAEDTKYVMIDDQMAAGKFTAIATWSGPNPSAYFSRQEFRVGDTRADLIGANDRYRNTMLAKLYLGDAQGLSHYRLVHETGQSAIVSIARQTPNGWTTDINGDGRAGDFVNRRLSSSIFSAVQRNPSLAFFDVHQPARVKTFERVPGAKLTGQVNTTNATTVFATVRLQTNTGRNFTYIQSVETDGQGHFEMTVPYATTNSVGPSEGGTDSGVVSLGKYELLVGNPFAPRARGNTSVPEPAIYDAETIRVNLEPVQRSSDNETNTSTGTNSSSLDITVNEESMPSSSPAGVEPSIRNPTFQAAEPIRAPNV